MSGVSKFVGTVAGVVSMVAAFVPGGQPIALAAAAVAAAANVGAQLAAKKPPAATGSVNKTTIGASQPRPYLIGETYYGGNRIQQEGFGGKVGGVNNPYLHLVDVYSGAGPVGGFVAPYLDFVAVPLNGNAATGYAANHLYVYRQLGLSPEPQALSTHWPGAQGWSAQHKLSSFAAISWCLRFDEDGKRFAAGVPQTGAVWRGVLAYDPRKDSTYPGGNGPHRWADPNDRAAFAAAKKTWEWTRCPGLHGLRYALGTWERDELKPGDPYRKTFGIGIPIDGIRVADFVALANVCDANGWRVDGVITEPGNRDENLKNILAAGGAERCWVGGRLALKLSAPRVPLDTITEYDLANDDVEVGAMQGWESRLNTIVPKYRSPDHKWEYVPSQAVTIASYVAEDGEEKTEERQYNLVQSKDQAAQLAAYELLDARELGEIVLTCKPRLRRYGAGDLLIVHLPDDGLVQQPCVILKRTVDPVTMTVELILRGETAAKHDFALGRTGTAPPTPRLVAGDVLDAVAIDVPIDWDSVVGPNKPDDNADVTGENTAKDTFALGGRDATFVLNDILTNAGNTLNLATDIGSYKSSIGPLVYGKDGVALVETVEQMGIKTEQLDVFVKMLQRVDPATGSAFALWSVGANGVLGSISQFAGPGGSITGIYSDLLIIWDRNDGADPIEIARAENGQWRCRDLVVEKFRALSVDSDTLALFAVRRSYEVELAANVTLPYSTGSVAVASLTLAKDTAESALEVEWMMRMRPGGQYAGYFELTISGSGVVDTVWYWKGAANIGGVNSVRGVEPYRRRFHGLPKGTVTVSVRFAYDRHDGGTGTGYIENGSSFSVEEIKR